jgi:hypothetical protein
MQPNTSLYSKLKSGLCNQTQWTLRGEIHIRLSILVIRPCYMKHSGRSVLRGIVLDLMCPKISKDEKCVPGWTELIFLFGRYWIDLPTYSIIYHFHFRPHSTWKHEIRNESRLAGIHTDCSRGAAIYPRMLHNSGSQRVSGLTTHSDGFGGLPQPFLLFIIQIRRQDFPAVRVVQVYPFHLRRGHQGSVHQFCLVWSLHNGRNSSVYTRNYYWFILMHKWTGGYNNLYASGPAEFATLDLQSLANNVSLVAAGFIEALLPFSKGPLKGFLARTHVTHFIMYQILSYILKTNKKKQRIDWLG